MVLIIGGSKTYHGAPILAALAARRFCDLVYFSSTEENKAVMKKMKAATPNVIACPESLRISQSRCILVGTGWTRRRARACISDTEDEKEVRAGCRRTTRCQDEAPARKVHPNPAYREFKAALAFRPPKSLQRQCPKNTAARYF